MIPNLKEKLAQIQVEPCKAKDDEVSLDFTCSEYTTAYSKDYLLGDVAIGDTMDIDYNTLSGICMEGFEHNIAKEDIVYFDTETTGLGSGVSTIAFLIGVGYYEGDEFIVRQFLMNDYHQETSMLNSLNDILVDKRAVVSFNGKAFDRHVVNSRSIMNRLIRPLEDMIHLDIMHSARRLYSKRIGSCSLGNLEDKILGMKRENDIPGALIPEVFAEYIKYKDDIMLKQVVRHNKLDIVNMTAIAYMLTNAFVNPDTIIEKCDIFSQGMIYRKLGLVDRAKMCYNTLGMDKDAMEQLAEISKKQKSYDMCIKYYSQLSEADSLNIMYYIELSKIYEHKTKELDKALDVVNRAIRKSLTLRELGYDTSQYDLEKRKKRISNKLSRKRKDNI